jgi:hypothetical protein
MVILLLCLVVNKTISILAMVINLPSKEKHSVTQGRHLFIFGTD